MVSVELPPGGREVPYARVLLLPAVLMAAATGAAAAVVSEPSRAAVGWCGAIGTALVLAVSAEAVRRGRTIRQLRRQYTQRLADAEGRLAAQDALADRVREDFLPRAIAMTGATREPREVVDTIVAQEPEYQELTEAQRKLVARFLTHVDNVELLRESLERSFVHVVRRVQAIVHQQAKELREMEYDHGRNPDVFDDLLRLDHGNSMIGRLTDSIAVLGGGRPGRQWPKPVTLYSVLRGAMSRILEYRRIDLASIATVNVKGSQVEPVIHACSELFDNATRYSPPNSKVHVTATEVQSGVAIEIEDAGVSFTEEARERIEGRITAAQAGFDLQDFDGAPQLGLAVVGRLTKKHNMQISLRPSAYGGVRAILVVPHDMLTTAPAVGVAHGIGVTAVPRIDNDGVEAPQLPAKKRRPTTGPRRVTSADMPVGVTSARQLEDEEDLPVVTEWTANGLPQRRSKATVPITEQIRAAYAEKYAEEERLEQETAARAGQGLPAQAPESEPVDKEPPPGLWVDAFMKGLKGDDYTGMTDTARTTARTEAADVKDEGDHK
ncbi:sensor histidine kinase [Streptomyces sp. NPDC002004]